MLIQLPNGEWIDPIVVQSVRAEGTGGETHVTIVSGFRYIRIPCEDDQKTKDMRDEIARQVNSSLRKESGGKPDLDGYLCGLFDFSVGEVRKIARYCERVVSIKEGKGDAL